MINDMDSFAERLVTLRTRKGNEGVSARDMSLSLGQSANYINKIEGKKAFPSMDMFFQICEFLCISPKDFFDVGVKNPAKLNTLINELRTVDEKGIEHMLGLIHSLRH